MLQQNKQKKLGNSITRFKNTPYKNRTLKWRFVLKCSLSLLMMVGSFNLQAQPNALVMGKISNRGLIKTIDLNVNQKYLDGHFITYTSKILEDNTFAFAVEVLEPQLVTLTYSRNPAVFYLEPNDTVYLDTDANSFQYSMQYDGKGALNNEFYTQYTQENPIDASPFTQVMFRQKNYWYKINQEINLLMQRHKQEEFAKKILFKREAALTEMDAFHNNNKSALSQEFRDFMEAEILYRWAYHMLAYGNVYKNVHQITPDYFDFLQEVPLQSDQIGNHWYREFLMAYMDYLLMNDESKDANFCNMYDLAEEKLGGSSMAFVQSESIADGLLKNEEDIMAKYLEFVENNPYVEYDEKVLTAYQKSRKNAIGASAPNFKLNDIDGTVVELNDFKGKIIMLNFWASWCRPCISKMNEMKLMQDEMNEKGIIFINVSLDRTEDAWKEAIDNHQFTGIQLFAHGNIDSDVAYDYDVTAIPQYFLIDQNGTFVEKPKSFKMTDIKESLLYLAK